MVAYHERTKHHFHRFAASVGYMDWATQPDPFRRYDGALLVRQQYLLIDRGNDCDPRIAPAAFYQRARPIV